MNCQTLILTSALLSLGLSSCHECSSSDNHEPLQVVGPTGAPVTFSSLITETPTVFIFTDTTCPIANRFIPTINKMIVDFPSVNFLMVYPDPALDHAAIVQHHEDYSISCKFLRDPNHKLVSRTGATRTPEVAVYLKTKNDQTEQIYLGRINNRFVDFGVERNQVTSHDLAGALKAALSGDLVTKSSTPAIGCKIPPLP